MHNKLLTRIASAAAIAAIFGSSLLPAAVAKAAAPAPAANAGQALEIAPPLIYLNVNPGQTANSQVLIRDVSNSPLTVTGQVNDFVASGTDGTPKVLLNETAPDPYSLKDWVVPPATLQLIPRQIKTLPITIHVPADASPGGHYGVIRFTGTAPSINGTNGVSLSASIGALMLLTVSGNITNQLSVQQFSATHDGKAGSLFQSGPIGFSELIKNTGNVHEQPIGLVTVKDMFGHTLATLPVNQPPANVLPGSSRLFKQIMDKSVIGNKRLFGHYTASVKLTYGTAPNKKTLTATTSFWVIPLKTVAIIIAILIGGFFAIRYGLRRYNQSVVKRASKNNQQRKP